MAYALERDFRAGAEHDTLSVPCGNGAPKQICQVSNVKLGSQMQKPNYNHPHTYPHMYSHMYSICNHISDTYTYSKPAVPLIYIPVYIYPPPTLYPPNICIQNYIYIYIYTYIHVTTYTDTYPNVSKFYPTIGKVSKCIQTSQTSQTYPSTSTQTQTQGNLSGHRHNSIHRQKYPNTLTHVRTQIRPKTSEPYIQTHPDAR